jgi:cytochrome P450
MLMVSGPEAVSAALAAPSLKVVLPIGQGSPAGSLLTQMARFSNGAEHALRRDAVIRLLPPLAEVAAVAASRASELLRGLPEEFDIMPLARSLPAETLALAMRLGPDQAMWAARLADVLSTVVAPGGLAADTAADDAANELCRLFTGLGLRDGDEVGAASILFQARDATAALIGLAVVADASGVTRRALPSAERIDLVLRLEAPVQLTQRLATTETRLGEARLPVGGLVRILLATAENDGELPATFGGGVHCCPGAQHAIVIAGEVLSALDAQGWRPVPGQQIYLEPRPNLRLPSRVMVRRS